MKCLLHLLLIDFSAALALSNIIRGLSSWDLRLAGPFQTVGCGAYHGGNLAIILTQLIADLVLVIQDAEDSATTPSAAYSTFFKNAKNAPFVAEVLTNVSLGAIMRPPVSHMLIGGPTFVCPRPGQTFRLAPTQGTSMDAAAYCEDSSASSAAYLEPTPFIMLCPKFFVGAAGPPTPPVGICPTFNQATNRFRGLPTDEMVDGDSIIHNQLFVLLEELVHYYITSSRVKSTKPEVYDINKAWKLSARKSLGNAASYGYYAASVHNNCNDWPIVSSDGRELMEVISESDNSTQDEPSVSAHEFGGVLTVNNDELLNVVHDTFSL